MVMNVLPQDLSNIIIEYEKRLQEKEFSSHTKRAYVSRNKKFPSYLFEQEGVTSLESQPAEEWPRRISNYREFLKSQQEASLNSINNSLTAIEDLFNSLGLEAGKVDREAWPKTAPKVLTQ